jgi:hypothetical protein
LHSHAQQRTVEGKGGAAVGGKEATV